MNGHPLPSSPKRRKVRPTESHGDTTGSTGFKPGNIISLRVWNFTTYAYGEFNLSPSLNMIIGPNGSGKSTFVAAVCLGLGGKIDLIKRKTMDSMIKSGERESTIEVTLKNRGNLSNVVIKRDFVLKSNRSMWTVNGKSSDVNAVRDLVRSFNIQLDNLCHFLPQERVAEFASLSPEKLLLETERTIGDNTLLDRHQLLVELDNSWVELSHAIDTIENSISDLRSDVAKFELEAQKFQEFQEQARHIDHHKKLLPYGKLQDLREKMKHLKVIRDSAKRALKDFAASTIPLEELGNDFAVKTATQSTELQAIKDRIQSLKLAYQRTSKEASDFTQEFANAQTEISSLKYRGKSQISELEKALQEKEQLENKLRKVGSVDESALRNLLDRRREKYDEESRVDEELDASRFELNALKRDIERKETTFREERKKLENNDRLEILNTTNSRYRRELLESAYEAHTILRKERVRSHLKYYEAPIVSCRVTNLKYAKYFEKCVDNNSLFAFFFENEGQYQAVSSVLPKSLNVPMRVVSDSPLQQPMSSEELKELGFEGYLADFITGPETVLRGLKHRSFLHCIPVASHPIDPSVIKKLLEPRQDGKLLFNKFVVENNLYIISRSRYGSKQHFYQTEPIGSAQLIGADGLTEDVKKEIQNRLQTMKKSITDMYEKRSSFETQITKSQALLEKVKNESKMLDTEEKALRKMKENRSRMEDTIKHTQARIESLTISTTRDYSDSIRQKESSLMEMYIKQAEIMQSVADIHKELITQTIESKKCEFLKQKYESRSLAIVSLIQELDGKKLELQERYNNAKEKYDEFKKGDAADEVRNQNLSPEDREALRELAEDYLAQNRLSESFILGKIEQLEEDLSVLASVDRGALEVLKSKRADLEQAERQLPIMLRKRNDLQGRMEKISVPWEKELTSMIDKISKTFQRKFVTVASDGQVELVKNERFKDWKLEILVKFRENSELKVLDHQSQSGGERAVTTIFFVMSLQGLTKAPIRIVDEINQGMDPKNEKLAHKYLVHTACKRGQSQYFLVTPKLLTGLYYHPEMSIHCIFTGPYLSYNGPNSQRSSFLNLQSTGAIRA